MRRTTILAAGVAAIVAGWAIKGQRIDWQRNAFEAL